jgi:predicted nucleotidyltransferase
MNKDDPIIQRLRELLPYLEQHDIARVRVFGSRARGDSRPDSDLDILVDFNRTPDLIAFAGLQARLQEKLGHSVDMVTPKGLHWAMKDKILEEAIDVF